MTVTLRFAAVVVLALAFGATAVVALEPCGGTCPHVATARVILAERSGTLGSGKSAGGPPPNVPAVATVAPGALGACASPAPAPALGAPTVLRI